MHFMSGVPLHPKVTFALEYWVNNCRHGHLRNCVSSLPSLINTRVFFFLCSLFLSFRFLFFFFFSFFSSFSTRRACKRHTVKIPRVGIGKSIARDAFKFHADSPVELITDIRHAATFPANFHQQFPAAQLRALFELPIEFTGCNCDEKKSPTGSRSSTVHYVQFKRMFLSARRSANT